MKRFAPAVVLLALAFAGPAAAETRNLPRFDGVAATDRIEVEVRVGPAHSVEVTGADAARVRTEVRNGGLRVSRTGRRWFGGDLPPLDALVRVTMPTVDSLASSKGAELRVTGVDARDISLAASMGGELTVAGVCGTVSAAASMGGVLDASSLQCEEADVAASMGGDVRVSASQTFDVAASMGASVNVAGEGRGDVSTVMGATVSRN